jgi:DNA adenine methylase
MAQLLPLVPRQYTAYHEPFLGGGTFFLALAPRRAVLADANHELMEMYAVVRDEPRGLMAALDAMQPHALDEAYFYTTRGQDPKQLSPVARAARFIYLNKTCYNGLYRVNRKGEFNVPFGRYAQPPRLYDRENLLLVARLLKRAELRCVDFEAALADAAAGDFVYLDPPYMPLTATANFTKYTSGAFGIEDQRRLAGVVRDLDRRGCGVLLSNSDTPLIRELYAGLRLDVVYAPRNINSDARGRSRIAELAIRNY